MQSEHRNSRSIASIVVLLALACLLVFQAPPICEFAWSRQAADTAACPEMPHKPPKKSAASNCAVPCAFTHAEIAIALPKMALESALHDVSIVKSLSGIKTGPAPPPPRIHDWFAIHKV